MTLANKITALRIAFIPVFIIILFLDIPFREYIAAGVFIIISLTDALDGYIARKRKETSTLGKLIDPLADKLLITAALIFLIGRGVEKWMAFIIIAREIAVTGLRVLVASKNLNIAASIWGKIKTISQIVAIVAVLINLPVTIFNLSLAWHLMLIATILTIISGVIYFYEARHVLKDEK